MIYLTPAVIWADDPPSFPDFTFKTVKPPKPGTKKRITVQIETVPPQDAVPATQNSQSVGPPVSGPSGSFDWFWEKVPAALSADQASRTQLALRALEVNQDGGGPRLQSVQTIAQSRGADILRATIGTDISAALVLAIISVESSGNAQAISGQGAEGLMQLIPDTAKRFGVQDSLNPRQNIKGGVAYLNWLMTEFQGDVVLALAGYNAGENAVKKYEGVPPFAETRDYVPKVLTAYLVARGLCVTRPELITDACALNLASN